MNKVKNFTTVHLRLHFGRCAESWNTLNDLSNKLCVANKTEDLKVSVFNLITEINESKTLANHISCEWKKM